METENTIKIPPTWCVGCIRDVKNLRMNDTVFIAGKYMSPYDQIMYAAKCPKGKCKHDK